MEKDSIYLLLAPGKSMFRSAKFVWERTIGAYADIDLPNLAMIEYLQTGDPRPVEVQVAVVMMVWEM